MCTYRSALSSVAIKAFALLWSSRVAVMMKTRLRSARATKSDAVGAGTADHESSKDAALSKLKSSAEPRPAKQTRVAAGTKSQSKPPKAEDSKGLPRETKEASAADLKKDEDFEPSASKPEGTTRAPAKRKSASKPLKIEYSEGARQDTAETSPYFPWKPDNWEQVLANVRTMRKDTEAPVDTMGCDKCPDQTLPEKVVRYQLLVSLMLSSQTKDEVTHAAVGRLREFALTPEKIAAADEKQIEELIYPVSFYKNKAKHLKRASQLLLERFDGDIPDSVEGLCSLPGVGPKMAYLAMSCGWGRTVGIGVDTHVHRIANRLGWLPAPTKQPEQTRKALEAWLPRDLWDEVNHLLVGFGQTVCKPVGPKCSSCLNVELCPFGRDQAKRRTAR